MSDDISEIVRQLRTGEAIDRTAIAATLERLSAGKEEAFQWADKFKARAEAAEARLHAMSDDSKLRWCSCKASARGFSQHMAWCPAVADAKCAACGHEKGEHHYNGSAYGVCGEFVSRADAMSDDIGGIPPSEYIRGIKNGNVDPTYDNAVKAILWAADEIERLRDIVEKVAMGSFLNDTMHDAIKDAQKYVCKENGQ